MQQSAAMRRKRLQNVADNLCHIFCGWRLIASKPILVELGSGKLEIDALTGHCAFQKEREIRLPIAEELSSWMQKELSVLRIPPAAVVRASLAVELSFSLIRWNTQSREVFLSDGKPVRSERMHRCIFDCASEIATDEVVYRSEMRDVQQWPVGWPQPERTSSIEKRHD